MAAIKFAAPLGLGCSMPSTASRKSFLSELKSRSGLWSLDLEVGAAGKLPEVPRESGETDKTTDYTWVLTEFLNPSC